MSKRQLEHLRDTLETIVDQLCNREQAVDEEQAHLQERLHELDERQTHIRSLEEVLAQHQATETQLATQLTSLVALLEERTASQPQLLVRALEKFEAQALAQFKSGVTADLGSALDERLAPLTQELPDQLARKLVDALTAPTPAPSITELVREMERVQSRALGTLAEQLSASLQASISVQLAPLSDDLPERLLAAVASAVPASHPSLPMAMPELVRELEKFETRSMASMAARMTAGLQAAMSAQLASLTDELPAKIASAVAAAIPTGLASSNGVDLGSSTTASEAALAARVKELAHELEQVRSTLSQTESSLVDARQHDLRALETSSTTAEGQAKLAEVERECQRLTAKLATNQAELSQAVEAASARDKASAGEDELVAALRGEINDLRSLLTLKEHDSLLVEELRDEIDCLRTERSDAAPGDSIASADEELRERLERATCEIIDLRSQNEELVERVTRMQIGTEPHGPMPHLGQEGLSWEERKRLLLQQLDAEQLSDESPQAHTKRVEINDVLRTTEVELARRDREIAELRSLLEQQSHAREGMAVGAAAVAQLIESDELVQQEREKLRDMQRSWDEKMRQAEIDVSMERAKLARERLQIEEQKHKLQDALNAVPIAGAMDPKSAEARSRKWLSRLGLKEET